MVYRLPGDLFVVVCRPALPKDSADVLAMTSRIWEGHDYVPHYWQEWLEDPYGLLIVAEYAGRVVGIVRITCMGGGEWWLQGLRVDPDYQGWGIASRLHDYVLDYWQRNLGGVLRLATSSARLPVHHLCERTGFRRVAEYLSYTAAALDGSPVGLAPLGETQSSLALDFVKTSQLYELCFGYIDLSWEWSEPKAAHMLEAARSGHAHWWRSEGWEEGLLVTGVDDDEDGDYLFVKLLGGRLSALLGTLLDARRLAGSLGYRKIAWMAPNWEEIQEALHKAEYTVDWEHKLYLYEKRLSE